MEPILDQSFMGVVHSRIYLRKRDAPTNEAARSVFFALYALQHRGQESCGIASSEGKGIFKISFEVRFSFFFFALR
jgi:hypothetical protein